MQRPVVYSLLGALLLLILMALPAAAQTEQIFLIGGNYRLRTNTHSMQGKSGFFGVPNIGDEDKVTSFIDTRLRLFVDIRPHPAIVLNYKMEIGDITFGANEPIPDANGDRLENVGGGTGGEAGSDGVNVETKNAYLDFRIPGVPGLSFRGGIIGWGDQFDWTILATDFTGMQLTYQRQALWTQLTFLSFAEGSLRTTDDDSNWFALDTRLGLSARTSFTISGYFWDDNTNDNPATGRDAYQIYAGLKFNTVLFNKGLLEIFGIYNRGQEFLGQRQDTGPPPNDVVRTGLTGSKNEGMLANINFDLPLGKHWIGLTVQYISGERGSRADIDGSGDNIDAFVGLFNSQYSGFGQSRFTEGGGLELITLGPLNDSTAGLNNLSVSPFFGGGYNGRILSVFRSKLEAAPALFIYLAGGWDVAARRNENGDRFRGIEFSAYMHWDIMPKLWLRLGGAFMLTGPWWDDNRDVALQGFPNPVDIESDGSADDIFQFTLRLQYDFG